MEPITAIVIGILTIIGSGSLTKVGENITDGTGDLAKSLWAMLKRKAPETQTVRLLESGQEIDIQQAVIDLEPIASDVSDPKVTKLLEEVRSLLASNQELAAKVEALRSQLSQSKSANPNKLAEKIGIVVQSGGKADIATFNMLSQFFTEDFMKVFTAVIEKDVDTNLYVGYVPSFVGAHSQGETLDELRENLQEVIAMLLEDDVIPPQSEFVGTQLIAVA